MVVSPSQCLVLTQNEQKIVSDLEKTIDAELRARFTSPTAKVQITTNQLNERVFNKIRDMYRSSGWQVVQGSSGGNDMRNLDPVTHYLEFTALKSAPLTDFRDVPAESFWDK